MTLPDIFGRAFLRKLVNGKKQFNYFQKKGSSTFYSANINGELISSNFSGIIKTTYFALKRDSLVSVLKV